MAVKRKRVVRKAPPPPKGWRAVPIFWRNIIYVAGGVAAIAGAITALPKATQVVEPYGPAHRGFVRDTTRSSVEPIAQQTDVLLYWKLEDEKNRTKREEGAWNVQLQRENDPASRALIEQQIQRATADRKKIDDRLNKLNIPDALK
jgi:hypothetical protein